MSYVLLIERNHQKTQTPIIAREARSRKRQLKKISINELHLGKKKARH